MKLPFTLFLLLISATLVFGQFRQRDRTDNQKVTVGQRKEGSYWRLTTTIGKTMTFLRWDITTIVGTQMGVLEESGASPLIQRRDGSTAMSHSVQQLSNL